MKRKLMAGLALLLLAPASIARADLTIEMKQDGTPMTTYVTADKFATTTAQGGVIFLGKEKVLRMVDAEHKKYTEMTEADAKAVGEKVAELQKSMDQLPPALRDKMKSAMQGKMPAAEGKRSVRPLNATKTINGFATTGYAVNIEGIDGETEVWAADAKSLGVTNSDVAVFKDLAAFMKTMIPGLGAMRELIKDYDKPTVDDVPGFPVLTIHRDQGGKETWRTELVKVDKAAVPAERFTVPAGYKQEKMKMGE